MAGNLLEPIIGYILAVLWRTCTFNLLKLILITGCDLAWSLIELSTINMPYSAKTTFWKQWSILRDLFVKNLESYSTWKISRLVFLRNVLEIKCPKLHSTIFTSVGASALHNALKMSSRMQTNILQELTLVRSSSLSHPSLVIISQKNVLLLNSLRRRCLTIHI